MPGISLIAKKWRGCMTTVSDGNIKNTIEAVAGLAKAVPIYQDALQPAAIEVGKALSTIVKTIHVALAPISALVWGYDQIKDFVATKVAAKLQNVPEDRISPPNPMIAGPILEALKYIGHEETLSDMYANLLATTLDSAVAANAHPAFVEVIKQLTPPEVQLIQHLAIQSHYKQEILALRTERSSSRDNYLFSNEHEMYGVFCRLCKQVVPLISDDVALTFLDNLKRLQIIEIDISTSQRVEGRRDSRSDTLGAPIELKQQQNETLKFTYFGMKFVNACIRE